MSCEGQLGAEKLDQPAPKTIFREVPPSTELSFRVLKTDLFLSEITHKTVKVNGGGVFVPSRCTFPRGAILELQLTVPGRPKSLCVIGQVVYSQKAKGFGVEFLQIPEKEKAELIHTSQRGGWQRPTRAQ